MIAWGDVDRIAERVRQFHDAGADHVCIQVAADHAGGFPLETYRALAPALLGLTPLQLRRCRAGPAHVARRPGTVGPCDRYAAGRCRPPLPPTARGEVQEVGRLRRTPPPLTSGTGPVLPSRAVDWILPAPVGRVVDLGAGTGALTRLLVDRADDVVGVEPDDRMRAILAREVPGCQAVAGRGEAIPVADGSADAVLASSSWHWMDLLPTLGEVGRVLVPGGVLGVVWSGPDPEGPFLTQARAMIAAKGAVSRPATDSPSRSWPMPTDPTPPWRSPKGCPSTSPTTRCSVGTWPSTPTISSVCSTPSAGSSPWTKPPATVSWPRPRRLLRELLGVEGEVTVDVDFRAEVWRSHRHS